jgi:hypothetical protein
MQERFLPKDEGRDEWEVTVILNGDQQLGKHLDFWSFFGAWNFSVLTEILLNKT